MKQYGARYATEFTKKQIGVIYRMAKAGELNVEQWIMSNLYDLADYFGYDDNRNVADSERKVLQILEAVFSGKISDAQDLIDAYTADKFARTSAKRQKTLNREMVASR